jgi:hypothetical protein
MIYAEPGYANFTIKSQTARKLKELSQRNGASLPALINMMGGKTRPRREARRAAQGTGVCFQPEFQPVPGLTFLTLPLNELSFFAEQWVK